MSLEETATVFHYSFYKMQFGTRSKEMPRLASADALKRRGVAEKVLQEALK